jgi:UPF0755 protein
MPNDFSGEKFIIVSRGERFPEILDSLDQKGIILSRFFFKLAARYKDNATRVQVGKYRFRSGVTNQEILDDLKHGFSVEWIAVTIPEGFTITQDARRFHKWLGIDSSRFVELARDSAFVRQLGVNALTLEGYLAPSTYKLFWQTAEENVLASMVAEFGKLWNDSLKIEAARRNLNLNDILKLASIVEWETPIDSERAIVASVYTNRLKKNILLQADPTVEYILPAGRKRVLLNDLKIQSPYNTYMHKGLPPGPINSPGKPSILAAMNPRKTNYLFFVATGRGGHTFTRNIKDHEKAVAAYRKFKEEEKAKNEK